MGDETHSDDLRNINKGDEVVIETTRGDRLVAECTFHDVQHADPRSGEIRETSIWQFDTRSRDVIATFLEGLKSSPDDPDFPVHKELWDMDAEQTLGYIEEIEIKKPV